MHTATPMLQALRTVVQSTAPLASRTAEMNPDAPLSTRQIRGDLDAIVAKALRTEPGRRYATVDSLKLDVARAARGEPVEARDGYVCTSSGVCCDATGGQSPSPPPLFYPWREAWG